MSLFRWKPMFWGGSLFLDHRKPTWSPPCVLWWSVWMTECDVWRWHPNRVPMTQVKWSTSVRTIWSSFPDRFLGPWGCFFAWKNSHFDNWKCVVILCPPITPSVQELTNMTNILTQQQEAPLPLTGKVQGDGSLGSPWSLWVFHRVNTC